ncbi:MULTISPECIES: AI-2E family transporter [Rhodomicrobium]|uniref:AI-2E family transporter n=1 Tax=Rhodomicrobium TaxID=1068 RepID=UPI000B4AAC0A|nr:MULTISPECIES: AI-2E family transporter [Rhodomicrobium]
MTQAQHIPVTQRVIPAVDAALAPVPRSGRDPLLRAAVVGLFVIALFYTLYFAAPVLIPITIAILLSMLLSPAVEWLERLSLPRGLASGVIVIAALGLIIGSVVTLAGPAQDWVTRLPSGFGKIEERLKLIKKPIAEIQKATEQIENVTELDKPQQRRQVVELRRPSFAGELLSGTQRAMTSVGIVIILLYFLLSTRDLFLRKLVALMPSEEHKTRTIDIARSVKKDISFYLVSLTLTNIGYGLLVTVAGWALGLENALLWGAVTAILSFAPYVGPVVILVLLSLASIVSVNALTAALALPAIYLCVLLLVQNLISPYIWGRRLSLNPVAIFISIILFGWMWGMAGALLAVPLLASFKIVAERVGTLRPAAEFVSP